MPFEAFEERYFGYIGVVFIILEVLGVSWKLEDILVILKFVGVFLEILGDILVIFEILASWGYFDYLELET